MAPEIGRLSAIRPCCTWPKRERAPDVGIVCDARCDQGLAPGLPWERIGAGGASTSATSRGQARHPRGQFRDALHPAATQALSGASPRPPPTFLAGTDRQPGRNAACSQLTCRPP